jgi:glycosyltransferase involved in cell wall biosynthesis
MKILYLTSSFPYPPTGGGALRVMGLLTGTAQVGHEVHLLSFGENIPSNTPFHQFCKQVEVVPSPTRSKGDRLKMLLLTRRADMEGRSWSPAFVDALSRILGQTRFDIVQLQSLEMGTYLEHVRRLQPSAKVIYDAYNAEADLQRMVYETDRQNPRTLGMAIYSRIQWKRLTRFEGEVCRKADGVITVSDADKFSLGAFTDKTPLWVVNNGIDTATYTQKSPVDLHLKQPSLIFTGSMDYRPNVDAVVWFAEEVLPHLEDQQAHFYIVGKRPNERVMTLAKRENVTVTGYVDDVLPYLHQGTIYVVPLRVGSGTRLKLLQAMSAGCVIVSTKVGAMGLHVEDGKQMMLANTPMEFVHAIQELLDNKLRWLQLSEAGQAFVREKFDWSVILPHLLVAYDEVLKA